MGPLTHHFSPELVPIEFTEFKSLCLTKRLVFQAITLSFSHTLGTRLSADDLLLRVAPSQSFTRSHGSQVLLRAFSLRCFREIVTD